MTVSVSLGFILVSTAMPDRPRNIVPRRPAIHAMVMRAFVASGFLNACVPLAIASTPVIAAHPEENARRIRNSVRPWIGRMTSSALATTSPPPRNIL